MDLQRGKYVALGKPALVVVEQIDDFVIYAPHGEPNKLALTEHLAQYLQEQRYRHRPRKLHASINPVKLTQLWVEERFP